MAKKKISIEGQILFLCSKGVSSIDIEYHFNRECPEFCVNSKYNIWYRMVFLSSCF